MFIIPDPNCPVIIPFGYACVGKTMLAQRLLRYLLLIGFHVQPELIFRNDTIYPEICSKYIPGLFEPFIKVLPVFSFIKHRKYIIQPFMSGLFCNDTSFEVWYNSGLNMYAEQLWHNIMKCIR